MSSGGCEHLVEFKWSQGTSAFELIYGVFVFCSNKATREQKVSYQLIADAFLVLGMHVPVNKQFLLFSSLKHVFREGSTNFLFFIWIPLDLRSIHVHFLL